MTKPSIKLLIVEDSDDDALLILHELRKGGFDPDHKRVDCDKDLQNALQQTWDIVITDHNMPNLDSNAALEKIINTSQDLPVIIVSGSIGEDIAVKAMKAGASDYIMKDNLYRLVPAIQRELREKEIRLARRQADAAIKHLAFHDSLTGLVNRTEFERRLSRVIHHAKTENSQHVFLYMDLDQFKLVNDTCGHTAGDELLKQLSFLLHKRTRERDTLARVGGDEFCLLLENCSTKRGQKIAEDLRKLVQDFRFVWKDRSFTLGVSIGVVAINHTTSDSNEIFSTADLACYAAKDKGRNCVQTYLEQDSEMLNRRNDMDWAQRIDEALSQHHFLLFYQPIVPVNREKHPFHCEILLRMLDPVNHAIILPGTFIPAAERYQRMTAIDRWVITNCFSYLAISKKNQNQLFNINLSGQSLSDNSLFNFIQQQLKHFGISPETLCFEITETAAIANFSNAIQLIRKIKSLGCYIALDDFGSGMSSFSYLKSLPVDYLKIDGSFVRNIASDEMDLTIVEAINRIGHKTCIQTIAECVESDEAIDQLCMIAVDLMQGYAIAKPSPLESPG